MPFPLLNDDKPFDARRNATALLIGLLAGVFGGLVGLGGGVVMVPLLAWWLGVSQHKAHGMSLFALIFTGAFGSAAYWLDGNVDLWAVVFLSVPATLSAGAGARFANRLPEWRLKKYLGFFLVFISLMLLAKPYLPPGVGSTEAFAKYAVLLATGGVTGFISGMMGVGGGGIMVPAMVLLAGMGQHVAQGSSLMAMVPAGASGAKTYWRLGNVATDLAVGLLVGIMIGSFMGGKLAGLLPDHLLRALLSLVLIYTGVKYASSRPK
jgi:uncharacterized membrane protein YfcA